ncbi:hypothetical protein B7494_g6289 [Chlorociboria aeruginascens]|nr:hypothetical protein B7494_g6289 [Chlorociboria aeruginascens]
MADLGKQPQSSEILAPTLSITTRTSYFLQLWSLKIAVSLGYSIIRSLKPTPLEFRPSLIKAYPCRPKLRNRIFIPRGHKASELLPLYLDVHGGGHTLCDAEFDDEFCATFANQLNIVVVSIEHGRAPRSKFPEPANDVVAISQAIIKDTSLPIDNARVVLGGFSSGGNICLSAAQLPAVREKIKGVMAWYPVMDFTLSPREKQTSRPYRNAKDFDQLKDFGPVFEWGYIRSGQNLKDPLLSTRFARAEDLPKWIFMIGAQYDMLANEARQTIFDLANLDKLERAEGEYGFEKGSYKWLLVRDVMHGFTHNLMDGKNEALRRERNKEIFRGVGEWLFKGPYARE